MAFSGAGLPPEWLDEAVELMGSAGRGGVIPVVGESMVPLLKPGQKVAVNFAETSLAFGDVAVFRNPAPVAGVALRPPLIVHRFLGLTRFDDGTTALRFRGDGVPWLDPKVAPGDVLGRVTAFGGGEGGEAGHALWWDLSTPSARLWGRMIAVHDLFWSVAARAARALDRVVGSLGGPRWTIKGVTAADRNSLALAHRLLFRVFHARTQPPAVHDEQT